MTNRQGDVDRFYDLMGELADRIGGPRRLATCSGRAGWPQRGVYFFFEAGEMRADARSPRVVRVGTHALTATSRTTLWKRLAQHKGHERGSYAGGGNHRGSVFRRHVGRALLATGEWPDDVRQAWDVKGTAPREVRERELPVERAVSDRIRSMPFLWLDVDDPQNGSDDRGVIEANSIALLSNYDRSPIDPASPSWLGLSSDRETIQGSGLWNVNHVKASHDPDYLGLLERYVRA